MKAIDLIATLAAAGVTGYFIYKVILPGLKDIQLPTLQFPNMPQPQTEQPQTPSTPTDTPSTKNSSSSDEEADDEESSEPIVSTGIPPPVGNVLYDSNKGWSGVKTAASGGPKWTTGAGGVGTLSCGKGHCRIYIGVKNYNARMEGEFMYTGAVDNISLRLRSRHQEGGACENRFGGFGASIQKTGETGFKTESCHNLHENSIKGQSVGALQPGKWYKFGFSCFDSPDKRSVNFSLDFNGKTVATGKHTSPKPYYMDEALHMKNSYVWLRSNNSGQGTMSFRNFRVMKLGAASALAMTRNSMLMEPYLYNGYYGRRRL